MNALTHLQRPAGDVDSERAATIYATALLNVAQAQGQAVEVFQDLQHLMDDVLAKKPEVAEFFRSAAVGRDRKAEVLKKAFGPDNVHPLLAQFLLVLNDHDRLDLLGAVLIQGQRIYLRRGNKFLVDVASAVPLTEPEQERVQALLAKITGAEPVLYYRVEPDLVGGLVIRTGSWLFDGSVRGRLATLREILFERQP